jgi:methylmalonyl-CoA/ethylmalonyl-CoA epimerase
MATSWKPDMELHHFGVLVQDIESCSRDYVEHFGYEIRSEVIHDPLQTAYVRFLALPAESRYIELVSPDGPKSFLQNALKRTPGLNHTCYATSAIERCLEYMSSRGAPIIRQPVPAVAFRNKRIAWFMDRNKVLVELVERGDDGELDFPPLAQK